jgi:nucleotide-binding universal stress UspA family protein
MALEQGREVALAEAAGAWYDLVYLPAVQVIRDQSLRRAFPGRTEADLYVWLAEHQAALEEALGWDVDTEMAAADLGRQSGTRARRVAARARERVLDAVTPAGLQSGPQPGTWRSERAVGSWQNCLFGNILVPVGGNAGDAAAVAQAAAIACREGSQLLGLHVVPSAAKQKGDRARTAQAEFSRHCELAGVRGTLAIEVGRVARKVCARAQWADLVVVGMGHPPAARLAARLNSELCALVRRCSTPVLAVPGTFSPLSRPLLAYNGGPKAREALFVAAYLAARGPVPLTVVSIEEDHVDTASALAEARVYLEQHGVGAAFVAEKGPAAEAILETAGSAGSDLILIGGYGHSSLVNALLGSTVDKVLQGSRQPVLVCR